MTAVPTFALYNGRTIYARGTQAADVPADFRGCSMAVFHEQLWQEWASARDRAPKPTETIKNKAISTARDRYGMRGVHGYSAPLLQRGS